MTDPSRKGTASPGAPPTDADAERSAGSGPGSLLLPRRVAIELMAHAQSAPDAEICGLILQAADGSLSVARVSNVAAEPGRRFEMDPAQLASVQRRLRETGGKLWAVYHSHPHAGAVPSALDRSLGGGPELPQLIVSLDVRGVLQLRGWRLTEPEPEELPIGIV